jgi:hypothetical protein
MVQPNDSNPTDELYPRVGKRIKKYAIERGSGEAS